MVGGKHWLLLATISDKSRDEFQLETPWPTIPRLIHDFVGIRFVEPLAGEIGNDVLPAGAPCQNALGLCRFGKQRHRFFA